MNLIGRFISFAKNENLFSSKDKLLLAVSGGVDSVVLCELCKQAGFEFIIAHCNFQLRGEESERDKNFVKELASRYEVPFHFKEFDTASVAATRKLSVQEAARELRYTWFNELINRGEATVVVTAHHLDDNIETMLMHFFRGTGIQGLRGMLPKQGNIARPLLFARKEELKQFAGSQQLKWVEDSSNVQDKYTRNYFRHQVLPLVQQVYAGVENNLENNLQRFADAALLYQQAIELHKKKLLEKKGTETHIPALKLKKAAPLPTIVYEIIKDYGFSSHQVDEVIHLLDSESGKYVQSASHRIIKNRNWLIIAPLDTKESRTILIEKPGTSVAFEKGTMKFESITSSGDTRIAKEPFIACLDSKDISFPLLLRKWKQGDYFYPLGMPKKKKLARFFIDQKLSMADKEKVWVLEMNKKIIWVVGMRIDDRFKITDSTKSVLKIELKAL